MFGPLVSEQHCNLQAVVALQAVGLPQFVQCLAGGAGLPFVKVTQPAELVQPAVVE